MPTLERFADVHDSRQLSTNDAQRYASMQQTQLDTSQWTISCASSVGSLSVQLVRLCKLRKL